MKLEDARASFIETWGKMGSAWGINRTMAQIHSLLLIAPNALTTDQIMTELNISRGNANMNIRSLIDWGLVSKEIRLGERKEFFLAEKDIWEVAKRIVRERKKRELHPLRDQMAAIGEVKGSSPEAEELRNMVSEINRYTESADKVLETLARSDVNWFFRIFMKFLR